MRERKEAASNFEVVQIRDSLHSVANELRVLSFQWFSLFFIVSFPCMLFLLDRRSGRDRIPRFETLPDYVVPNLCLRGRYFTRTDTQGQCAFIDSVVSRLRA